MTEPVGGPVADLEGAPLPTKRTLRHRKNIFSQFFKFMGFNTMILRMVAKGHQD
ncbi:hypothetical protein [Scrofimicrobium sp. R131]|uniref:Uncharacterized protein n=1 Tax=Scrofimicrobium appendicitidis TaxID=3079930 RepID=A0AAU7V5I2_9ACTO